MKRNEDSLKIRFKKNLIDNLTWRPFVISIIIGLAIYIKFANEGLEIYISTIKNPIILLGIFAALISDAAIRAVYWHNRSKDPNYQKKQKTHEARNQE